MNKKRFRGKTVFALTGMSECGKSTVGKYLDSRGIPRLKIVKLFEKIRDEQSPGADLREFVTKEERRDPYSLWDAFIEKLIEEMDSRAANVASVESLYGGGLGSYLQEKMGDSFRIIYIDAPEKKRLEYQMIRENFSDIEVTKRFLLPRDKIKTESGIPQLKNIADEIIDNSGSLEDLLASIDAIVERNFQLN